MRKETNSSIRAAAKVAGVLLWEIAEKLGMQDSSFSRKLRKELPAEEQEKILGIIRDLASERAEVC